jgi:hypothetical protein
MKVQLLKDVLLTTEVGRAGDSHIVSKILGVHLVQEGFATAVAEEGEATPVVPPKASKPKAVSYQTKPEPGVVNTVANGPIETK